MYDIDLHIIHFNEPQWMLDRCIASLDGQPVNIHIVEGIEEMPPVTGRAKGFAKGTAKYCSYIDPDDVVKPGAFAKLLAHDGADLIWGNEEVIAEEGGPVVVINKYIHACYLIKRGLNLNYSKAVRAIAMSKGLSAVHVDETIYTWNCYLGTHARMRRGEQ